MDFEHTSVMPKQVQEHQALKPGNICVDCTLGGAGHALETVRAIMPDGMLIGIDQDLAAIEHAKKILQPFDKNTRLFHSNFSELPRILETSQIQGADSIIVDLGFSLHQIKNSNRGFSFNRDEPLDMRMDTRKLLTASEIVNSYREKDLADLFFLYGEEKYSRRIARRIVQERGVQNIESSSTLAGIVADAVPGGRSFAQRIHPATRVFQALRIAVNQELEKLTQFMAQVPDLLVRGGRLLVISFHSLEDRIVKQSIRQHADGCTCPKELPTCVCGFVPSLKPVFKKPLVPDADEISANPMARSAKLRVAQRI